MAIRGGPDISENGLVLYLDAGNRKSYSGSGTTWSDLSGNRNVGTLTNGPIFDSTNGGSIAFANNDYVSLPNNTALDTQTPTVEVWIKTNFTTQNGFWFEKGSVNTQYSLFQENTTIVWRQVTSGITRSQTTTTANYISTSNWAHIVGTYSSGDRRTYINGVLVTSDTQTGTIDTNNAGMYIGAYGTGTGYFYNGNIAMVRVYNRVLSPQEIQQNFNATRSRFGI